MPGAAGGARSPSSRPGVPPSVSSRVRRYCAKWKQIVSGLGVTPGFMGSRGPCFLPSPPPLYLGPLLSGSHQPPLLHTPAVFPRRHRNRPASKTPSTSPWLGLLNSYTTFRAPAPMPRASSHCPAQGQAQITEHARHCCLRPRSPQEAPFDPCSLFSRRWRLFRPLALGTRSEFRTAWLMKCCFRREAESLFTWELARAGRQPGRGLWVRFGVGGAWEFRGGLPVSKFRLPVSGSSKKEHSFPLLPRRSPLGRLFYLSFTDLAVSSPNDSRMTSRRGLGNPGLGLEEKIHPFSCLFNQCC